MDQQLPLVSIVVPIFNGERFLQETIASVLAQTYPHWELLLVDDGSRDRSPDIACQYAEQYPSQIYYLEHRDHHNLGVCSTRNLGICYAKGDYVAFLDADDIWLPQKLEQQVEIMETHPNVGMVFSMSRYWSSWDWDPLLSSFNDDYIPKVGLCIDTLYPPQALTLRSYPLGKAQAPCPSNILLRRSVIDAVGGFEESFQRSHQLYEDQAFLSKVYLTTSVYISSQCWDYYRLHKSSCMATSKKNYSEIRLFFLKWFESYLQSQGIQDQKIRQALQSAYWPYKHPYLFRLISFPTTAFQQIKEWIKNNLSQLSPSKS